MEKKQQLTGLLARTSRAYKAFVNAELASRGVGLSSEMCGLLIVLWGEKEKSQQELVEILKRDKAGITRIINSLKQRGLITSYKDKIDRRRNKIKLTQKGERIRHKVEPIIQKIRVKATVGISVEDREIMKNTLLQMIENMEIQIDGGREE